MKTVELLLINPDQSRHANVLARGRQVIRMEAAALRELEDVLDDDFVAACELLLATKRQVIVTGMGKSGHIARKIAATLSATGTPAAFLHPAEAAHGDLGMLTPGDVLMVLSNSGNTAELRAVLAHARALGLAIIGIAARRASQVMDHADVRLVLPQTREACAVNLAPTSSTAMQLALGDALAMAVMDLRGMTLKHLRTLHPGGRIGLRLTPIAELMHGPEALPLVKADTAMPDTISVITRQRFGLAGVVNAAGALIGVISDGDLRRHFEDLQTACAGEVMTRSPRLIPGDMMAADALELLNEAKITAAFVVNRLDTAEAPRPIGIIHIHDLLNCGLG